MSAGNAKKDAVALASTVQNVLAQAARNGMQSIAMPLIGNGNAGWPTALAAQAHLQGLLQFVATDKDSSVLKVPLTWLLLRWQYKHAMLCSKTKDLQQACKQLISVLRCSALGLLSSMAMCALTCVALLLARLAKDVLHPHSQNNAWLTTQDLSAG